MDDSVCRSIDKQKGRKKHPKRKVGKQREKKRPMRSKAEEGEREKCISLQMKAKSLFEGIKVIGKYLNKILDNSVTQIFFLLAQGPPGISCLLFF